LTSASVTNLPFPGRHRASSRGSTTVYCTAQSSGSFLRTSSLHWLLLTGNRSLHRATYRAVDAPVLPKPDLNISQSACNRYWLLDGRTVSTKLTDDASYQKAGQSTAFRAPSRFAGSGSQTRAELNLWPAHPNPALAGLATRCRPEHPDRAATATRRPLAKRRLAKRSGGFRESRHVRPWRRSWSARGR